MTCKIIENLNLAREVANKVKNKYKSILSWDELYSCACMGLVLAAKKYSDNPQFDKIAYKIMFCQIRKTVSKEISSRNTEKLYDIEKKQFKISGDDSLCARDRELLNIIMQGYDRKESSEMIGISDRMVRRSIHTLKNAYSRGELQFG